MPSCQFNITEAHAMYGFMVTHYRHATILITMARYTVTFPALVLFAYRYYTDANSTFTC